MNEKSCHHWWGKPGTAIAEGLVASKFSKAADITVTKKRNIATLKALEKKGVNISADNNAAIKKPELLFLQ